MLLQKKNLLVLKLRGVTIVSSMKGNTASEDQISPSNHREHLSNHKTQSPHHPDIVGVYFHSKFSSEMFFKNIQKWSHVITSTTWRLWCRCRSSRVPLVLCSSGLTPHICFNHHKQEEILQKPEEKPHVGATHCT